MTTILFLAAKLGPGFLDPATTSYISLKNYVSSLCFASLRPVLALGWTLNYEILFYGSIFLSLLISLAVGRRMSGVWLILAIYAVPGHLFDLHTVSIFVGSNSVLEFLLGDLAFRLLSHAHKQRRSGSPACRFVFGLCIASVLWMTLIETTGRFDATGRWIVFGVPSMLLVFAAASLEGRIRNGMVTRVLTSMGDASYSTYLTHWPLILLARAVLANPTDTIDVRNPLELCVCLIACLSVGQLVYRVIDAPMQRLGQSLIKTPGGAGFSGLKRAADLAGPSDSGQY